jgi:hypothetical protein
MRRGSVSSTPRRLVLLAPGAGAPSSSAWMQSWAKRLSAVGRVVAFDYPYMREGRKSPDPLPRLIAAHRAALAAARSPDGEQVVLAGKSMGGRVGCHAALEDQVDALVCLGYPLKGAGAARKVRDQVLLALRTPILFAQGDRDPLCPLDLLAEVRPRMQARSELCVVEGGDHSLAVRKTELARRGETQDDVDRRVLAAIEAFVGGLPGRSGSNSRRK